MSNWQLFISAGLPTATGLATIGIALILNGRIEAGLDRMDATIDTSREELQSRIDRLADQMFPIHESREP